MSINIWEIILNVIGWLILALIIYSVVVAIVKVISNKRAGLMARRAAKANPTLSDEAIIELAEDHAKALHAGDILFGDLKTREFNRGVKYALTAKGGHTDVDSV